MSYRKCFVPTCKNDSKNSPDKIFVRIRNDLQEKWCREVNTEYFKMYTIYCCEDHINPQEDLKNYYKCKLIDDEPVLKPTATLKNTHPKIFEEVPSIESMPRHSELKKILLQSQPITPIKKTKLDNFAIPSTSSASPFPVKVHVGIQCGVKMVDKSTNYRARKETGPLY
ncbi:hypothetical protein K1T71_003857 [Dendrolimus kikuchii]|uniref:Uncharacterized protein n=1 Tax=Dendrolimus kikuchii TaxID=765133 RepID=A0ACC1D963_9NEOP|nr:hypothetical protein K1T71_003857 [Dendrolimus kikuchii]